MREKRGESAGAKFVSPDRNFGWLGHRRTISADRNSRLPLVPVRRTARRCRRSLWEPKYRRQEKGRYVESFLIVSPTRTRPGTTTRQLAPRTRSSRPTGELTNLREAFP